MSGHSKWKNIQHRKGRQDAKRSKEFTRAAKEIIIAAKSGGNPEYNPRLRTAIALAKSVSLPRERIDSAIRKGTGEEAGGDILEITYEGYGTPVLPFWWKWPRTTGTAPWPMSATFSPSTAVPWGRSAA